MPDDGIFYDADARPEALQGKTIAILPEVAIGPTGKLDRRATAELAAPHLDAF